MTSILEDNDQICKNDPGDELEKRVIFSWDFLENKRDATSKVSEYLRELGYKEPSVDDYSKLLCSIFENENIVKESGYKLALNLGLFLREDQFDLLKTVYLNTIED